MSVLYTENKGKTDHAFKMLWANSLYEGAQIISGWGGPENCRYPLAQLV